MADKKAAPLSITAAVVRAVISIPPVVRTGTGQHGGEYATLDDILKVVRPAFAEQGLMVTQYLSKCPDTGKVCFQTMAMNEDGETHSFGFGPWFTPSENSQAYGSQQTYMMRQCYQLVLPIGGEDDDGAAAPTGAATEMLATPQQDEIKKLVTDAGMDADKWLAYMKQLGMADSDGKIYATKFDAAKTATENAIAAKSSTDNAVAADSE